MPRLVDRFLGRDNRLLSPAPLAKYPAAFPFQLPKSCNLLSVYIGVCDKPSMEAAAASRLSKVHSEAWPVSAVDANKWTST